MTQILATGTTVDFFGASLEGSVVEMKTATLALKDTAMNLKA